MSHVVLSKGASGEQNVDEVDSLEAALEQVEHLRNDGGVSDVRILREVPIEVKTYYKVVAVEAAAAGSVPAHEVVVTDPVSSEPPATIESPNGAPPGSAVLSPPPAVAHPPVEEEAEALATDRRSSLFGRG